MNRCKICENCEQKVLKHHKYCYECGNKLLRFNNVETIREKKGINQTELAKQIEANVATISYYENDLRKPCLDNLTMLANYFEVTIDYIALGNKGRKPKNEDM